MNHSTLDPHCTLAVSGRLAALHTTDLLQHCQTCLTCRDHLQQLDSIHNTLLLHSLETCEELRLPAGAFGRFRAHAIANNIPVQPSPKPSVFLALAPALAAITAFALLLSAISARTVPPPTTQNAALTTPASAPPTIITSSPRPTPPMQHHGLRRTHPSQAAPAIPQQAALAPERFRHTAPALDPYFTSPAANVQTASFPSLSSDQIHRLNLFHTHDETSPASIIGLAALHLPLNFIAPSQLPGLTPNIEHLRFNLPPPQ